MNGKVKQSGIIYKMLEGASYILFVVLGFYFAFWLRYGINVSTHNIEGYYRSIPYIAIISIIIFYMYNIVKGVEKSLSEHIITIAISLIIIDVATIVIMFFNRDFILPRGVFLIGFFLQFAFIFTMKTIITKIQRANIKEQDTLIIASQEESESIAMKILLDKNNFDNIKYITSNVNNSIYNYIDDVDKVYIGSTVSNTNKLNIIKYCSQKNKIVGLVPGLFEISLVDFKVAQISDMLIFKIEDMGLSREEKIMKRIMDIAISLIGIVITLPIQILVAILIKSHDGGPVFYKQVRVTENNNNFNLYKFRTMIVNAEEDTGPVLAKEEDSRIIPIGRILRASRIDELPQLLNVLRGDMSIVGPRPERPFFVEQLNKEVEEFRYRVVVKAGITGLAQILGRYSTNPKTKAKYDLLYIRNYSLLLDIKIIFNTIKVMFIKDSSRGVVKDKKLKEVFSELNLEVYEELDAVKVE